jgi:endoribonuclease Nob1
MEKHAFVLDASGINRSAMDYSSGGFLIPRPVYLELSSEGARTAIDAALGRGDVRLVDADDEHLKKASIAAQETGDIFRLSKADLDVLAVACRHGASILSDDYAIQNTAAKMGINVVSVTQEGIRKQIKWVWACGGCGRSMEGAGVCAVCGHKARRRPSKS